MMSNVEHLFTSLLCICMSSLEKCLFRSFSHFLTGFFVFLVFSCMSYLYILEINPLLFHLLLFSAILRVVSSSCLQFICRAKAFKFNQVPLVYFCFYFHYSRKWVIEDLALCHRMFCLFSSMSFIVSDLTFRSLIHFEFIFGYGVRKCSNFILLHGAVQFSQHHLLKRLSLPHCIFLPRLSKIWHHRCMGLFLGFLSSSIGILFCFFASTILSR